MEVDEINSLRAAVDVALTTHAPALIKSYDVSPEVYDPDSDYVTISVRDSSSVIIGWVSDTVNAYEDMGILTLTFYTPNGSGDAALRTIRDNVKNTLQNTKAGDVFIDSATVEDTPLGGENTQIALYLSFDIRSYNDK